MTTTTTPGVTMRTYTRVAGDLEQTVTVNIDPSGYIRMTATNLHDILSQLGFNPIKDHT